MMPTVSHKCSKNKVLRVLLETQGFFLVVILMVIVFYDGALTLGLHYRHFSLIYSTLLT
jgi:hypothetical protein